MRLDGRVRGIAITVIALVAVGSGVMFALGAWHEQQEAAWGTITDPDRRDEIRGVRERLAAHDFKVPIERPDQIRSLLETAEFQGEAADDARVGALLDLASAFFHRRFADADADAYVEWRKELGYIEEDWDWLERAWTVSLGWPEFTGSPFPEGRPTEEIFKGLFTPAMTYGDGASQPVRLAASPGIAVRIDSLNAYSRSYPHVDGTIGEEYWYASPVGTFCQWWIPPVSGEAVFERNGSLDVATVAVLAECADGSVRPFYLGAFWDPQSGRWWQDNLGSGLSVRGTALFY